MLLRPAPLASVLGVRSDGAAGSSSASDLLITVFGELMRPAGTAAWTQTLVAALALVDVEEKAARQAISRLADKGWLTSQRVGRRTRWARLPSCPTARSTRYSSAAARIPSNAPGKAGATVPAVRIAPRRKGDSDLNSFLADRPHL